MGGEVRPVELIQTLDPEIADGIERWNRVTGLGSDSETDRARSGVGHEVEPAPTANGIDEARLSV